MGAKNDKMLELFFSRFTDDHNKYLIPKMPYFDEQQRKGTIDYAIISQDPSLPRIAVLIRTHENERSKTEQLALESTLKSLYGQNWAPVVFTSDDISFRSRYVTNTVENVLRGGRQKFGKPEKSKKRMLGWLAGMLFFTHSPKMKNIDVALFTSSLSILMTFCILHAVGNGSGAVKLANGVASNDIQYIIASQEKAKKAEKPAPLKADNKPDMAEFNGKIVPVINLDEPQAPLEAPLLSDNEPDKRIQQPIYLATVRFCTSGTECLLKNNTRIQLWGVQSSDSPQLEKAAQAALNERVAGQQLKLEPRYKIADKMVVKAMYFGQDIAQEAVKKGLLTPNDEGDIYRANVIATKP